MTDWDDMEPWERLAGKLSDAGPTEEDARTWVLEVIAIAREEERQALAMRVRGMRTKVKALPAFRFPANSGRIQWVRRKEVLAVLDE